MRSQRLRTGVSWPQRLLLYVEFLVVSGIRRADLATRLRGWKDAVGSADLEQLTRADLRLRIG